MINPEKEIIKICRLLYERRYISPLSGNVSVLLPEKTILITPSKVRKYELSEKSLCKLTLTGKSLTPERKHSSEYRLHCMTYNLRNDIKAVVHAHPKYSVICSLATITFESPILPETALSLGTIPTVPYATPGTEELARNISDYIKDHNALILERHGVITFGGSLAEAFDRLEEVEHAAEIAYLLSLKGRLPILGRSQLKKLVNFAENQGFYVPDFAKRLLSRILAK